MSVGLWVVTGLLGGAVAVYLAVVVMCWRAARAARRRGRRITAQETADLILDVDGVLHGLTPPAGLPRMRPPVPTPRNGIAVGPRSADEDSSER